MQSVGGWHSSLKGSCTGKRWGGCGSQGELPPMTRTHHYWSTESNQGVAASHPTHEEAIHMVLKESGEAGAILLSACSLILSQQYPSLATRMRTVICALQPWEAWLTIRGKLCRDWMGAVACSLDCTLQSSGDSELRPHENQIRLSLSWGADTVLWTPLRGIPSDRQTEHPLIRTKADFRWVSTCVQEK